MSVQAVFSMLKIVAVLRAQRACGSADSLVVHAAHAFGIGRCERGCCSCQGVLSRLSDGAILEAFPFLLVAYHSIYKGQIST